MKGKHTHCCILCIIALLMCNALKAAVNDRYTLVKDTSELANGDEFIIVDKSFHQTVGSFKTSRFDGCPVTLEGNDAVISDPNTTIFVLEKTEKYSYIKTLSEGKYLSGNNSKDEIKLSDNISSTDKDLYKVTFNFENNNNVKIEIGKTRSKGYNHFYCNNKNEKTYIWKIYASATDSTTYIYKKSGSATTVDITLDGLNSTADNAATLKGYDGKTVDKITLKRGFAADGGWYTLCLPFALTANEIKTTFKGALFNEFKSVSINDQGVAQLKFRKVTETQAGVPYMVLPRKTVENPVFTNKTITETPQTIKKTCTASDGKTLVYQFVGVYNPTLVSDVNNIRFVGGDKGTELLMPIGEGTIKGLRAYFLFPNSSEGIITQAKLNIDDDSTTGINSVNVINANHSNETNIYTLSGQQVSKNQKTLKPGIYLKNGKKIMVR